MLNEVSKVQKIFVEVQKHRITIENRKGEKQSSTFLT